MTFLLSRIVLLALLIATQGNPVSLPGSVACSCVLDSDGDGLGDSSEIYKYGTDPFSPDSDGDGILDSESDERREFAYTVKVRMLVVGSWKAIPEDLSQDATVVRGGEGWTEIEAVLYPFAMLDARIDRELTCEACTSLLSACRQSSATSSWSKSMAEDLLKATGDLRASAESERDFVEGAATYLLSRAHPSSHFSTFWASLADRGGVEVAPDLIPIVDRILGPEGDVGEVWKEDLFAAEMYESGARGSCSSTAIFLCGGLRALGVPSRVAMSIPLADASVVGQREMVEGGITNLLVRRIVLRGLRTTAEAWTSHTYNSVWADGAWRFLNYRVLDCGGLDASLYGLSLRLFVVNDWLDANLASSVGYRQFSGERTERFSGINPYRLLECEDRLPANRSADRGPFGIAIRPALVYWRGQCPERQQYFAGRDVDAVAEALVPGLDGMSASELESCLTGPFIIETEDGEFLDATYAGRMWVERVGGRWFRVSIGLELPAESSEAPPHQGGVLRSGASR